MKKSIEKEKMKQMIVEYVENVILSAEKNGSLNHFKIEITNQNGSLQLDHKYKER